ncbi:hypothetical protein HNY73_015372 [Argiope bruennichi]|uniref:Secreted protein n=1 Tax=Argiope bruennichi TaxID=94029 RepID=A0A8T0ETE1_ARGBR|nr:hypothetical protein HNY73_015372 [Argiope bruennichi]
MERRSLFSLFIFITLRRVALVPASSCQTRPLTLGKVSWPANKLTLDHSNLSLLHDQCRCRPIPHLSSRSVHFPCSFIRGSIGGFRFGNHLVSIRNILMVAMANTKDY